MKSRMLACLLVAVGLSTSGAAEDSEGENIDDLDESVAPKHCISLPRIDRTEILDNQNILFFMKGGKIYQNRLPHKCPGLARRDTFMYRTSLSQLCNVDIITVLDDIGFGFSPGASCGLGQFYPRTTDQVEALKADAVRNKQ